MNTEKVPGSLILEDSAAFEGICFGSPRTARGEVVFNTGMVGYPETLTDPSYRGQILVLTYPLIGNYGVPSDDREDGILKHFESERIQVEGLIIADLSHDYSHWNAKKSLEQWLKEHDVPAIYGVDTRALTKRLREKGTMAGCMISGESVDDCGGIHIKEQNFVEEVSTEEPVIYEKGDKRIVLVDCGVKNNIIRAFLRRNITVKRVPWDHDLSWEEAHGVIISNGPDDPKICRETIKNVRKLLSRNDVPVLGICLGSQILALAAGADTYKLKYGHRSQNQPCVEVGTKRCYITSQNHGYAVDSETLPEDWREWFYNINDNTNEGLMHISKPFFGAQFHPEASPGPDDTEFIFDMFLRRLGP
ncbi:MAG: glutamine-hydrolyzing carbamoyl-phosphate synthase small subunit [Thermoplasmata archaeon]